MKLRRALAAAAATAVIAPAALMAAPAAYANEEPVGPATTETEGASNGSTEETGNTGSENTENTESSENTENTEGTTETTEEAEETGNTDSEDPGDKVDEEQDGKDTTPDKDDKKAGETPGDDEDEEGDEEFPVCEAADFKSSLSGFPNKIVAGSGWKEFHLNLDNTKGDDLEEVIIGATVLYKDDLESDFERDLFSKYAKFQYFDGERWSSDLSDGGTIGGWLPVEAGEKVSLKLRLSISASAPAGSAVAIAFGVYGDEENCYLDEQWYDFEVVAAGKKPGDVKDAK
ncbi:MAG TPA: hypothetical protein VFY14_17890, partial [Streptomyces sp.]|nr:hypothetical protein [Streptomyces sp.]